MSKHICTATQPTVEELSLTLNNTDIQDTFGIKRDSSLEIMSFIAGKKLQKTNPSFLVWQKITYAKTKDITQLKSHPSVITEPSYQCIQLIKHTPIIPE